MKWHYLLFLFILFTSCGFDETYTIRDLGLLAYEKSVPVAINDHEEIVGYVGKNDTLRIFFWSKEKGAIVIDSWPEGWTRVNRMNNQGMIIGEFSSLDGWLNPEYVLHAFCWDRDKGFQDLGSIDGQDTYAADIDDQGRVLLIANGSGYLWDRGSIEKVEMVSHVMNYNIWHNAVMNSNRIAFAYKIQESKTNVAIANLTNAAFRTILDGQQGIPFVSAINDEGIVAGFLKCPDHYDGYFVKPDGQLTLIPHFLPSGIASSILVGEIIQKDHNVGGIYRDSVLTNINEQIVVDANQNISLGTIRSLRGVNRLGQIIGVIDIADQPHAILLDPVGDAPQEAKANSFLNETISIPVGPEFMAPPTP